MFSVHAMVGGGQSTAARSIERSSWVPGDGSGTQRCPETVRERLWAVPGPKMEPESVSISVEKTSWRASATVR